MVSTLDISLSPTFAARARSGSKGVCATGMSKIANNSFVSGSQYNKQSIGPIAWAAYLMKQAFSFDHNDNFGYSGDWTDAATWNSTNYPGIVNRVLGLNGQTSILTQTQAKVMISQLATNDRNAWTADQSIGNIQRIVDGVNQAGIHHVLMTDDPRGDSGTGNPIANRLVSPPQLQYASKVNDFIRSLHGIEGITVVDTWPMLASLRSTTGDELAALFYDGLHENQWGAYYKGILLQKALSRLFMPRNVLPGANIDARDATYNPSGLVTANPYMSGTGGTPGAGGSGALADGYISASLTANGLAGSYSKVDGATSFNGVTYLSLGEGATKDWQQVVLTGTASTAAEVDVVRYDFTAVAGDVLSAVAEIEVDTSAGICGVYLRYWDAGGTFLRDLSPPGAVAAYAGPAGHTGVMQTMRRAVLGGAAHAVISVKPVNGATVNCTFRVRGLAAGKNLGL